MAAESEDELNLENLLRKETIDYSVLRKITNNFSDDREIGRGAFGVVYKGVLRDGFVVAVKKFISVLGDKDFQKEVGCLAKIKHPNIVRYLCYCAGANKQRLGIMDDKKETIWAEELHQFICFEYLHNGSLANHLIAGPRLLEWHVCYKIIQGICLGLKYLHEQKIIHRDIKPGNILLDDDMSPKIADFGLSRFLRDGRDHIITKKMGTVGYMAPETFRGEFALKSDIFSLGSVIRQIVRACMKPSEEDTVLEWSRRLNQLDASKKHTALEQVKACIEISVKCSSYEAVNRPTIHHIVHELHIPTDWSVASDVNSTSLAPPATNESEVLPGPSSSTPVEGLGNKVLSSRSLQIEWGKTPGYWRRISLPGSRFDKCAELLNVYFLAVTGEIPQEDMPAGATYEVYLVYKLTPGATGLRGGAVLTSSLRLYGERIVATSKVSLDPEAQRAQGVTYPVARSDGWLEIRLAEFTNDGWMLDEKAVIVDLREVNVSIVKSGLIIECMEFRIRTM